MSIDDTLPPCELRITSLRQPARNTLSPISVQARITVAADSVKVPGNSTCSSDLPMVWTGRNSTDLASGTFGMAASR